MAPSTSGVVTMTTLVRDIFSVEIPQGVKAEKKMVDGKPVEDFWASSKKVCQADY